MPMKMPGALVGFRPLSQGKVKEDDVSIPVLVDEQSLNQVYTVSSTRVKVLSFLDALERPAHVVVPEEQGYSTVQVPKEACGADNVSTTKITEVVHTVINAHAFIPFLDEVFFHLGEVFVSLA
jgi:hypothetical protein